MRAESEPGSSSPALQEPSPPTQFPSYHTALSTSYHPQAQAHPEGQRPLLWHQPCVHPVLRFPSALLQQPAPCSSTMCPEVSPAGTAGAPSSTAASPAALRPHVWHGRVQYHTVQCRCQHSARRESSPQGTASGLITAIAGLRNTEAAAHGILITWGIFQPAFLFHLQGKDKPIPLKTIQAWRGTHIDKIAFQLGLKVTYSSAAESGDAGAVHPHPVPSSPSLSEMPAHHLCLPPGKQEDWGLQHGSPRHAEMSYVL